MYQSSKIAWLSGIRTSIITMAISPVKSRQSEYNPHNQLDIFFTKNKKYFTIKSEFFLKNFGNSFVLAFPQTQLTV